ncbi:MAG: N-acetyl-alpha-D-glucosaminyl L-malate synthase BshA [Gemmatimonadaceae bacterium]|nr:N-acetyl-alpha-D-glucosaminyl L-malate synthase BshA [Gemmatimonadaceae bacterium]
MKIGITCYPTYGGSGAVATELGIALAARGHEVHFITYAHPFRLPAFSPRIYFHEVSIGSYPLFQYPPYDLALAVKMHEVATQQKLDLLHVHYAIPHATSAWLAKQMLREAGHDLPVVTTLHGTDITIVGQDHSYHAITKFSIEKSDRVTAVSQYLKDETVRAFGCDNRRVEVIPNFVDPVVFDRGAYDGALREQLGGGRKVLMHISNMRPVKRVTDVVQIFAAVRREIPSVLVMVGDGPDRSAAEEEARRLDVEGDVRFLGKIDGVAPLLASADLYLLTTDLESFGLSALEAQACGVPVLGYNVGGLPEVVESGVTGHLGAVGDIVGMAGAAIDMLGQQPRWQAMSAAAVARASGRFATDRVLPMYESLYADAVR